MTSPWNAGSGSVVAVHRDRSHRFGKQTAERVELVAGLGVRGDAHAGTTVQHRSRLARTPDAPNLRQVHLIGQELLDEVSALGFDVGPGRLGENITTAGIDLLALPARTRLRIGEVACVELTGLRNPCRQIEAFRPGLLAQVVHRGADGSVVRRAGVMSIVIADGVVMPGDAIRIELPAGDRLPLEPV